MNSTQFITHEWHASLRRLLPVAIAVCYIWSILSPVYHLGNAPTDSDSGFEILAIGWLGLLYGFQISWLANPLIAVAWVLLYLGRGGDRGATFPAMILAVLAAGIGNQFLFTGVCQSEAGVDFEPVTWLGAGYWLWMASIVLTFALALLMRYQETLRRER